MAVSRASSTGGVILDLFKAPWENVGKKYTDLTHASGMGIAKEVGKLAVTFFGALGATGFAAIACIVGRWLLTSNPFENPFERLGEDVHMLRFQSVNEEHKLSGKHYYASSDENSKEGDRRVREAFSRRAQPFRWQAVP